MKVRILRQACCAADDQAGPLELQMNIDPACTWEQLLRQVLEARFLQFSSSHAVLTGFVGERAVLRVRASQSGPDEAIFLADPADAVADVLGTDCLDFRFLP